MTGPPGAGRTALLERAAEEAHDFAVLRARAGRARHEEATAAS